MLRESSLEKIRRYLIGRAQGKTVAQIAEAEGITERAVHMLLAHEEALEIQKNIALSMMADLAPDLIQEIARHALDPKAPLIGKVQALNAFADRVMPKLTQETVVVKAPQVTLNRIFNEEDRDRLAEVPDGHMGITLDLTPEEPAPNPTPCAKDKPNG